MPNYTPIPFAQRRRSEQYTKGKVILVRCSLTDEAWEGLRVIAESYREDKHKLPVTRFLNRYAREFRIFKPPPYVLEAYQQQGNKWLPDDFSNGEQKRPHVVRITDAVKLHLEVLPVALGIPIKFSTNGGYAISMSLELIGRGWIIR